MTNIIVLYSMLHITSQERDKKLEKEKEQRCKIYGFVNKRKFHKGVQQE